MHDFSSKFYKLLFELGIRKSLPTKKVTACKDILLTNMGVICYVLVSNFNLVPFHQHYTILPGGLLQVARNNYRESPALNSNRIMLGRETPQANKLTYR